MDIIYEEKKNIPIESSFFYIYFSFLMHMLKAPITIVLYYCMYIVCNIKKIYILDMIINGISVSIK